jgi:Zn finger protein HypA/HybF involved in hydrogenase expression
MMECKCSCCGKKISEKEFLTYGGLCEECARETARLYIEEGVEGVRKYYEQKRRTKQ